MEESQVSTGEQNKDDMKNFTQEIHKRNQGYKLKITCTTMSKRNVYHDH